jgi:hypothetical protein
MTRGAENSKWRGQAKRPIDAAGALALAVQGATLEAAVSWLTERRNDDQSLRETRAA